MCECHGFNKVNTYLLNSALCIIQLMSYINKTIRNGGLISKQVTEDDFFIRNNLNTRGHNFKIAKNLF